MAVKHALHAHPLQPSASQQPAENSDVLTFLNVPFGLHNCCCLFRLCANTQQDVIILPEEAVYKKVDTGREGERVYLMEIAGNRRFFYWMQDKDADKDEVSVMKEHRCLAKLAPAFGSPASLSVPCHISYHPLFLTTSNHQLKPAVKRP